MSHQSTSPTSVSDDLTETEIRFIVNNIGPNIQRLGRELQLDLTQRAELDQGNESLKDKAFKMIDWWKNRESRSATKSAMVAALRKTGRNDIGDELLMSTAVTTQNDWTTNFTTLQQSLIEVYSKLSIPQPPNVKKDLAIDEIFIDQEMEIPNTNKSVKIKEIFEQTVNKPGTRILVEGYPGFGKSTLAIKLASDWSKGKDYISKLFNLVMLIPLREIEEEDLEEVIVGVINRAIDKTTFTKDDLECYLKERKVLFVLDGYDELTQDGKERLRPIVTKKKLQTACILFTSRGGLFTIRKTSEPSHSLLLFRKQKSIGYDNWDMHFILKGLSMEQSAELITKFDIGRTLQVEQLGEMTNSAISINFELLRSPLLAFWVGYMLEDGPIQTFRTRTEFYKTLLNFILHKTLVREKKIQEDVDFDIFSITDHFSALRNQICEFGTLAVQRLISGNLSFTQNDLQSLTGCVFIESDVFVKYRSFTKQREETYYQPMHKSFLEFLAAFSFSKSKDNFDEFKESVKNIITQGLVPSQDSLFFPFVAGLMEHKTHWLLKSLVPWSAIYHVCQPEIINILLESETSTDEITQTLLNFVPCLYKILPITDIPQHYFSSDCHIGLFQAAVERKMLSVIDWDLNVLEQLPVESIELDKLYVRPFNVINSKITSQTTSIHCNELILLISEELTPNTLKSYMVLCSTVKYNHRHLYLDQNYSNTCTSVLNYINDDPASFQRIRLFKCLLFEKHFQMLTQIVKNNRITKGINIQLDNWRDITFESVSQLWDAVVQSPSVDEFTFHNCDWTRSLKPRFDLTLCPKFTQKCPFEALNLGYNLTASQTEGTSEVESIQELTLYNKIDDNVGVTDFLRNFRKVQFLEIYDHLLSSSISFGLFSTLNELFLGITGKFTLPSPFSVEDQMPSLTMLTVAFMFNYQMFPTSVEEFLKAILRAKQLNYLGFKFYTSDAVCNSLNKILTTKLQSINLDCLDLILLVDTGMEHVPGVLSVGKQLLANKQLKQMAIGDVYPSPYLRSVLASMFAEEEFQLTFEIQGSKAAHSNKSRLYYNRFMNIGDDRFVVELKDCAK